MSTVAEAYLCKISDDVCQGDVYKNVKYTFLDSESDEAVTVCEFTFPMAIIVSQACDVISMSQMVESGGGKTTKFMPSILMCPIYNKEIAKRTEHVREAFDALKIQKMDSSSDNLFSSNEYKVAEKDWHYRYHPIYIRINKKIVLENAVIDFKHYFTVPASYLVKQRKDRLFRIDDIYAEQITLKYATYLSRVAIPDISD